MRKVLFSLAVFGLCFSAFSQNQTVPFEKGTPIELQNGIYTQKGNPVIRKTIESALRYNIPESQEEMQKALGQRTASRWCMGLGIPLIIGGTVNMLVASSGTVGSNSGTAAVYFVAAGLFGGAAVLETFSLLLSSKSAGHYKTAIERYNSTVGPKVSLGLLENANTLGAGLQVVF
jgi:hypothetical protein